MLCYLGQSLVGKKATIEGFAEGKNEYHTNLRGLGRTKGIQLKLTRFGPLGDPLVISISGLSLSLGNAKASAVVIDPPAVIHSLPTPQTIMFPVFPYCRRNILITH